MASQPPACRGCPHLEQLIIWPVVALPHFCVPWQPKGSPAVAVFAGYCELFCINISAYCSLMHFAKPTQQGGFQGWGSLFCKKGGLEIW